MRHSSADFEAQTARIDVRFDGGDINSDGGWLLLRQVERQLGLPEVVAKALPDLRNPWLVQHATKELLQGATVQSARN